MMKAFHYITLSFSLTVGWSTLPSGLANNEAATLPLLLISFDGFRWDYLNMLKSNGTSTPNFDYFINNGVTIKNAGVKNAFITKTFPNHYTIVTGMYEENHGVVGNEMYDPKFNISSDISHGLATNPFWFNNGTNDTSSGAEPIWITNQKASHPLYKRESGVYFWPGSEVSIQGMRPRFWFPYDDSIPYETRVTTMVNWLAKRLVNLGLLYFDEPDRTGHGHGPNSVEVFNVVKRLDDTLGQLKFELEKAKMWGKLNIIITSDHGMASVNPKPYIKINELVSLDYFDVHTEGVISNIFPKENQLQYVYEALKKAKHMTVYLKDDIPSQYHYRFNRRIGSILAVADEGWEITTRNITYHFRGDHGYNNSLPDMQPIFIALGPAFKMNSTVKQFNNVDIYPLMCYILNLIPGKHDGSFDNIKGVLRRFPGGNMMSLAMILTVAGICVMTTVLFVVAYCIWGPKKVSKVYINSKDEASSNKEDDSTDKLLGDYEGGNEMA